MKARFASHSPPRAHCSQRGSPSAARAARSASSRSGSRAATQSHSAAAPSKRAVSESSSSAQPLREMTPMAQCASFSRPERWSTGSRSQRSSAAPSTLCVMDVSWTCLFAWTARAAAAGCVSSKSERRGWCSTAQTAIPCDARPTRHEQSSSAAVESRPEVGSSRKRRDGSAASSTPTLTRLRCPPERPLRATSPMAASLTCVRPSKSTSRTTHSFSCDAGVSAGSRSRAETQSDSVTVSVGSITSS
mmetsp:Transcript_37558/g.117658  ORF Transcript_37558/g.117658 Transcript_37558/m.117658 type:complete len:247 (-) Transcript_37558:1119-1859(-)